MKCQGVTPSSIGLALVQVQSNSSQVYFTLITSVEFFQHLLSDKLTGLPAARVAYSDQAYTITGFALEGITGKAFPELVMESVIKPLGLSSTGIEAPDLSRAIISDGDSGSFMGFDIGNFNA